MTGETNIINALHGKKIVLGIGGGIAAYKSAELARLLVKTGADVHVVMTEAGERFVGRATFQALSGNPVCTSLWDEQANKGMAHITLGRADAILVAPATANLIARLAHGMADDLLSTLCLARDCPLLIAPAMNRQMWSHPATRRNVATLEGDGVSVLGPDTGEQACGEIGEGRMLEPGILCAALIDAFAPKPLAGRKVVITAGPTFEAIDPVRGLTNPSSGRMGYAIAAACARAGADVVLVSGPVALPTPPRVRKVGVTSALSMREAVFGALPAEVFVAVAAVADYRPATVAAHKIKKSGEAMKLELIPNPDILAEVAALENAPFCVGFAAESHDLDAYAESKRRDKRLPMVVGNLVADGLGGGDNTVVIYDDAGRHPLPRAPKGAIADWIVDHLARLLPRD